MKHCRCRLKTAAWLAAVLGIQALLPNSKASLLPNQYQHHLTNVKKPVWTSPFSESQDDRFMPQSHQAIDHEDESIWRLEVTGDEIRELEQSGIDIWQIRQHFVDIRVTQEQLRLPLLQKHINSMKVLVPAISELIQQERLNQRAALKTLSLSNLLSPDTGLHAIYHPFPSVESLLHLFASDFPSFVKLEELGKSPEGRSLWVLKVSDYRTQQTTSETWREPSRAFTRQMKQSLSDQDWKQEKRKLGMALLGGQHAREWISPATLLYIAHSVLAAVSDPSSPTHKDISTFLSDYELHIIPVSNPDGYDYTWTHDRLWQRSRQHINTDNPRCQGIDLNRNWPYKFEAPARPNACSDLYPGTQPFQAQELQVIGDYLRDVKKESGLDVFIDMHSFGQMLMYPYSYSCSVVAPDAENLYEALLGAGKAIHNVHKQNYEVGSVCDVSYTATGQSLDWTYHDVGVRWSFSFNLRDQGVYAFLLPPDQIVETGQELLAGLLDLAEFIAKKEKVEPASL